MAVTKPTEIVTSLHAARVFEAVFWADAPDDGSIAVPMRRLRAIEPTPWIDPQTGRTEVGSIVVRTLDPNESGRLTIGRTGHLDIRYESGPDEGLHHFGPVRVAFNYPTLNFGDVMLFTIVFEPVGRR